MAGNTTMRAAEPPFSDNLLRILEAQGLTGSWI